MAIASVPPGLVGLKAQLADLASSLTEAHDELRGIARGLHPAILSDGGLLPAAQGVGPAISDCGDFRCWVQPSITGSSRSRRVLRCGRRLGECRQALPRFPGDGIGPHRRCEPHSMCAGQRYWRSRRRGKGSGPIGLLDRVEALGASWRSTPRPEVGHYYRQPFRSTWRKIPERSEYLPVECLTCRAKTARAESDSHQLAA